MQVKANYAICFFDGFLSKFDSFHLFKGVFDFLYKRKKGEKGDRGGYAGYCLVVRPAVNIILMKEEE